MEWPELIKLTIALIAVIDVPSTVPIFLQQTRRMSPAARQLTALVAGVATAAVLLIFANFGEVILSSLGITIDAFRILGGIVMLLIALEMLGLIGDPERSYRASKDPNAISIGVFPIAVPLSAGPGPISTVMIYAHQADVSDSHDAHVSLIILIVSAAVAVCLFLVSLFGHLIGQTTQTVLNRLLGMIVGALGIQFILEGVAGTVAKHMSAIS
ncbi:MAG: MarC family protein [Pseudomonadota bacterium]